MLNGNLIKGLLIIKLRSWLFVNATGASGPFHNRDRACFGCILGEIGAFGPQRPWLASPAMHLRGPRDKSLVNNYRPVSVLPLFFKILEKIMYSRLIEFVNRQDLLYKYQIGFREK